MKKTLLVLGLLLAWGVQAEELTPEEKKYCETNAKQVLNVVERVKPSNVTTAVKVCIDESTDLKNLKNFRKKYEELGELEVKLLLLKEQNKSINPDLINRINTLRIAKLEEMKQYGLSLRSQLGVKEFIGNLFLFALGSTNYDVNKKVDFKTLNDINYALNIAIIEKLNEINKKYPKLPKSLKIDFSRDVSKFELFLRHPDEFIKSHKKVYPAIINDPKSLKLTKFDCELIDSFGNTNLIKENGLICE